MHRLQRTGLQVLTGARVDRRVAFAQRPVAAPVGQGAGRAAAGIPADADQSNNSPVCVRLGTAIASPMVCPLAARHRRLAARPQCMVDCGAHTRRSLGTRTHGGGRARASQEMNGLGLYATLCAPVAPGGPCDAAWSVRCCCFHILAGCWRGRSDGCN